MKVVIFGASGMVGQGVLLECLRDPGVESILTVVRKPSAPRPANFPNQQKVRDVVHADFQDFAAIGLGKADRVARLEIYWPTSGTTQVFEDIAVNQGVVISEFAKDYQKRLWKPIPLPN